MLFGVKAVKVSKFTLPISDLPLSGVLMVRVCGPTMVRRPQFKSSRDFEFLNVQVYSRFLIYSFVTDL